MHLLALELLRRGHRVTTFAVEGSDPRLSPISLAPAWGAELGTPEQPLRDSTYQLRVNRRLQQMTGELDLVHLHTEATGMAAACLVKLDVPCVATVHSGINDMVLEFLKEVDEELSLVAISRSQREQAPGIRWVGAVHNSVPIDQYQVSTEKKGYLVELARVTMDKGQHIAIEVAERTGMPLVLAGKVDREADSRLYFREKVQPRLTPSIRWIEDVKGAEKSELLGGAVAMIFPIQWEEPFGLAMVEAMVCGTPVVAFRRGAAKELVEPGITGFLVDSVDEMVARVGEVGQIDPAACAKRARERFSPKRMGDGYEAVYRKVLAGG